MSDSTPATPTRDTETRVSQNVAAVRSLHEREHERVGRHQRLVEKLTRSLGQPRTIYVTLGITVTWIAVNLVMRRLGLREADPPPFYWLQGAIALCALLMTTMVLTTQNGQGRHTEQRAHLDLQVNLFAEQKIAKLIALLEELRHDLPSVRDRKDAVAEEMATQFDPEAVISALEGTFQQAIEPGPDERDSTTLPSESIQNRVLTEPKRS